MKEPWGHYYKLYHKRGKLKRIKRAGKIWPKEYNMFTSDVLRLVPKRNDNPFSRAIPASEWRKNINLN